MSGVFIVLGNHAIEDVHNLLEVRYPGGQLVHDVGHGHGESAAVVAQGPGAVTATHPLTTDTVFTCWAAALLTVHCVLCNVR